MSIYQKIGVTAFIGPLTGLSFYGAWKQRVKYNNSSRRWAKIDFLMDNFVSEKLDPDMM